MQASERESGREGERDDGMGRGDERTDRWTDGLTRTRARVMAESDGVSIGPRPNNGETNKRSKKVQQSAFTAAAATTIAAAANGLPFACSGGQFAKMHSNGKGREHRALST